MPGFTIHIAIAKQYMKKHPSEIKNEDEFIKGVIAPDMNARLDGPAEDKSENHYGKWGKYEVETHLDEFLNISGNGLYLFILTMSTYCTFLSLGPSGV